MRFGKLLAGAAVAAGLLTAGAASAGVVTATGSGWISSSGGANNGAFADGIANSFIGVEGDTYYDWFKFVLPTGPISSATLSIWNDSENTTIDPLAQYSVHAPSSFTFAGLGDGVSFGSVLLGDIDNGVSHYVDIVLNSAGLSYLNAHLGGEVTLGGSFTSIDGGGCHDCIAAFGYTDGTPAAQLSLSGGVPEPATWGLMIMGFGGMGAVLRRRRAVAIA